MNTQLAAFTALDDVDEIRVLGAIGVIQMKEPVNLAEIQKKFVAEGIWVRPFGKLVYVMPPYISTDAELTTLISGIYRVLEQV